MGTIIVHAGMGKAGSSSIQRWLERVAPRLLEEHGMQVLVARRSVDGSVPDATLVPYEKGGVNSGLVYLRYVLSQDPAVLHTFMGDLDRHAGSAGSVLVTNEGLATLFAAHDVHWLAGLERLAADHDVHVVYYVRPQHEWVESAWKQWGYRSGLSPVGYFRQIEPLLDYAGTRDAVCAQAPSVSFDVRRFQPAALPGGDVVADFATAVLGSGVPRDLIEAGGAAERRANRSFSLTLVNLLRFAAPGRFWDDAHDNRATDRLKGYLLDEPPAGGAGAERGRALLQRHCHRTYEPGNRALIQDLAWPIDHFVPPIDDRSDPSSDLFDPDGLDSIEALDALWCPDAGPAEREIFYNALDALLDRPPRAMDDR